ncbi:hypothetical protein LOZ04_005641 [Ophidiomyces ophidiicola]|uniref:uncharacterized protein n=1 Tax=Ophidiomyces ophidiicola TaxID=1387563 RepID=UPI0020C1F5BD|nr:uncharacterized protein LOZ57_006356 [Ophidiomyces ophidiicola]KAI1938393.1 hypothetical protein LOZ57_006356 [Ophidiomyces ophidiicola]KAI1961739.1 hypothetical protein LOZ56_006699 [Ophidiomyces ophidiicola]KAI2045837.1 hypothetical protein LOZ38_005710 [Ophidiomyces ophidiicola]KAI2048680.1 hypothetical protein LOZ44_003891 [Ophidiomyces ophidiicola]KAI2068594.1 hypothetical protein LOZ37_005538 [Ophidiomyces ophidiicola]
MSGNTRRQAAIANKTETRLQSLRRVILSSKIGTSGHPFSESDPIVTGLGKCKSGKNPIGCSARALMYLRHDLVSITDALVFTDVRVEEARVNQDETEKITLAITKSTAIARTASSGWSITAKLAVKAGDGSGEVTVGYTNTKTETITDTRTITDTLACGPRKRCSWETHTFRAKVRGKCEKTALAGCSRGKQDMCRSTGWDKACQKHREFAAKECINGLVDCEVEFALLAADGKPLQELVWNPQPI